MQDAWKFFLAFVVVLALIGVAAWLVRRFGSGSLGAAANRGRLPRLAVIDAAPVDNRRRLVLVRRDNIEHLIMIGGPSDVVIEANITRAPMPRAEGAARPAPGAEFPGWSEGDAAARPEPQDLNEPSFPAEPPPRAMRPMSPAADEPRRPPRMERPLRPEPPRHEPRHDARLDPPHADTGRMEPRPDHGRSEPLADEPMGGFTPEPMPRHDMRAEPRLETPPRPMMPRPRPPEPKAPSDIKPPPPRSAEPPRAAPALSEADQNLAEMAQRLEAALRRPGADPRPAAAPPIAPDTAAARAAVPRKPATPGAAPASPAKSEFDSFEDEMASLLGRPKNPS